MTTNGVRGRWRNERLGLSMIAASLAVIAIIVGLLVQQQREAAETAVRAEGRAIMRILAAQPEPLDVIPAADRAGTALDGVGGTLAYAVLMDGAGNTLEQAGSGVHPPAPALPLGAGLVERTLELPGSDGGSPRRILEFQVPHIVGGGDPQYLRVGYFRPRSGPWVGQLPFFASLALAVFLLTPVFYYLVRHEIRPIRDIADEIEKIAGGGRFERLQLESTGTVKDLLERFNNFAEFAEGKRQALEEDNARLLTSAKLLGYQKQRMERVLEAIPDVVLVLDDAGAVSFANGKVRGLFGITPEEVVGRSPEEWCNEEKVVDFITRCRGKSVARQLTQLLEFAPQSAPDKCYALRFWPLLCGESASGNAGTLLVFRDVTSENLAARSRGEFVAHLAHELKTPLTVLAMYAETLQGPDELDETERVEAVNTISDEVQRLAMLIDNLLNITRIEMGSLKLERQRVNLRDLLQDAFDHVSRAGKERGLEFALEVPENLPSASLDKPLLRVAINNLLSNAIKYSEQGGRVTLGAEDTPELLRIYVSDSGIGITPEDQERIFERMFRSEDEKVRDRPGHGLGLSLARDIVQLHHGALRLESEPGKGSTFTIELWKESVMIQQAS